MQNDLKIYHKHEKQKKQIPNLKHMIIKINISLNGYRTYSTYNKK